MTRPSSLLKPVEGRASASPSNNFQASGFLVGFLKFTHEYSTQLHRRSGRRIRNGALGPLLLSGHRKLQHALGGV